MPRLEWRTAARDDLAAIIDYIAAENLPAAIALLDEIEAKIRLLPEAPRLYRAGRVEGTREMVVRPNFVIVYAENARTVTILRVLHAARQWP